MTVLPPDPGTDPMTTVAFLGLGAMGAPMAANLLAAGFTVRPACSKTT
jgi:predicted dinucleotide-binding enzyme